MDELLFIETIRVEDGTFVRPELHLQRMRQTVREAYGVASGFDLADGSIPLQHRKGTVKCRIVYGRSLSEISFAPYVPREIRSLRLVAGVLRFAARGIAFQRLGVLAAAVRSLWFAVAPAESGKQSGQTSAGPGFGPVR